MTLLQLLNITNKQKKREVIFVLKKQKLHCLDYDWDSKLVCVSKIGNGSNIVLYIQSLASYRRQHWAYRWSTV